MRVALPLMLIAVAGCASDDEVDFPAILSPLEESQAPAPTGAGPTPELISVVSGGDSELWWAHGTAYVHGAPDAVWAAAKQIEVCVDRREVTSWTATPDVVAEFDASYAIHNRVEDIIAIEYDVTWVHELQAGSADAPELVVAQWEKTDGTPFIDLLQGSVVLRAVDDAPEVTALEIVAQLKAPQRDDATMVAYVEDFYADLVATVHGEPLPVFDAE